MESHIQYVYLVLHRFLGKGFSKDASARLASIRSALGGMGVHMPSLTSWTFCCPNWMRPRLGRHTSKSGNYSDLWLGCSLLKIAMFFYHKIQAPLNYWNANFFYQPFIPIVFGTDTIQSVFYSTCISFPGRKVHAPALFWIFQSFFLQARQPLSSPHRQGN